MVGCSKVDESCLLTGKKPQHVLKAHVFNILSSFILCGDGVALRLYFILSQMVKDGTPLAT